MTIAYRVISIFLNIKIGQLGNMEIEVSKQ